MADEGKIETIARELCRAAGKNPDKTVRFGTPLTLDVEGCQVTRVVMLPPGASTCAKHAGWSAR
jgi:hypothetical protein